MDAAISEDSNTKQSQTTRALVCGPPRYDIDVRKFRNGRPTSGKFPDSEEDAGTLN